MSIFINKLEAARRQLDAAIRLTFSNEDALAIHTLGAAAYRIVRDILHKRRQHAPDEFVRNGIYQMSMSLAHGEMSHKEIEFLKKSEAHYAFMCEVAEQIKVQGASGNKVTIDQVSMTSSKQAKISHWQTMSKVASFLKHAERDADSSLNLDEVDNDNLLFHASGAYVLASHHITPEIAIFYMYFSQKTGTRVGLRADEAEFVDVLERLSPARRRRTCAQLIRISKRYGGALPFWNT
jgi:hypothetical protein